MKVSETDLGEWIVQLAGERPSHMVMPAIHMTKEQVAEVFSKEVNERLAADIPALVKLARKELRTKFLNAEMGISGANIAVAETGSIVIITNEGNARLVTTLPQDARGHRRRGEAGGPFRRRPAHPDGAAAQRDRAVAHQLRFHHHRALAQYRRQPEEPAHRADGQSSHRYVGRPDVPARRCSASAARPA